MKVLMISDVYSPLVGGQEKEVQILSEGLSKEGHEVIVCTINHDFMPSLREENGVRVYRIKGFFQRIPKLYNNSERKNHPPVADWIIAKAVRKIVKAESPEIIHSHGWMSYSVIAQDKTRKIPLCVTFHDYGFTCPCRISSAFVGGICERPLHSFSQCYLCMRSIYGPAKSLLAFSSLRHNRYFSCEGLISTNPNILERMNYFKSENYYLEHPINADEFRPIRTMIYKDRILVWGKLERIKGIDIVFQAARILSEYQFDVAFIGNDKEYYKAIKPPNVRLIPKVTPSAVPEFINMYPMVMGQFMIGSLGLSELEAMSCGKPVIAYWNRKYDIFYDTPCPVISSREIEQIVNLVRANTGNGHIGLLNRQWILKTHSSQRVVAKLAKIYEDIIGKKESMRCQ